MEVPVNPVVNSPLNGSLVNPVIPARNLTSNDKKGKNKMVILTVGVLVIIVFIILFVFFRSQQGQLEESNVVSKPISLPVSSSQIDSSVGNSTNSSGQETLNNTYKAMMIEGLESTYKWTEKDDTSLRAFNITLILDGDQDANYNKWTKVLDSVESFLNTNGWNKTESSIISNSLITDKYSKDSDHVYITYHASAGSPTLTIDFNY